VDWIDLTQDWDRCRSYKPYPFSCRPKLKRVHIEMLFSGPKYAKKCSGKGRRQSQICRVCAESTSAVTKCWFDISPEKVRCVGGNTF
jgi:hypothetical protein